MHYSWLGSSDSRIPRGSARGLSHLHMGSNRIHPPTPRNLPEATPTACRDPRLSPSPSQTELPSHLKHYTKSRATGQKTQLFLAVTLLNLIFPTGSLSCFSRMKCIFGLCHKTLHFVKAIHFAAVICKCTPASVRSGGFTVSSGRRGQNGDLCGVRWRWYTDRPCCGICLSEAPKKERFGGEQIDLGLPLQLELQKQDLGFGRGGCW